MGVEIQTRSTASEPVPRAPIRAIACVLDGWRHTRGRYWSLLGITSLGMLIAGMAPLGILMGPMMCGIYLCYLNLRDGRPAGLDTLFEGFEHFVPSLVASLITLAAVLLVVILFALATGILVVCVFLLSEGSEQAFWVAVFVWLGLLGVAILAYFNILYFFMFAYLLIVDRGLEGWPAVKTSIRVTAANLGGLVSVLFWVSLPPVVIMLLVAAVVVAIAGFSFPVLMIVASLWWVIAFLVMPPVLGAITEAYRTLYPAREIGGS